MIMNGLIGFAMMITVLFCVGDAKSVLDTKTGFPFLQVFFNSVKSAGGAVGMGVVVLILTWACATGITTTASRMTWSFARDKGTPFSRLLGKVDPRTQVPIISVCTVTGLAALLALIYIGSSTAFNDVISLTITGFYGSYFLPCAFLLWHRIGGRVLPHGTNTGTPEDEERNTPFNPSNPEVEEREKPKAQTAAGLEIQGKLNWGPWHIPGILGTVNNAYACTYMLFVIFWSVWPPTAKVKADTMNYSVVVTGGVMIFSVVWYYAKGRRDYHGPIVDEDVVPIIRRAGSIVAL
jgi:choline transport protein